MTSRERNERIHAILYSNDDREELAERVVALEDLAARMYHDMQGVLDMSADTVLVDNFGTLRDAMDRHMYVMRDLGFPPTDYEKRQLELGVDPAS